METKTVNLEELSIEQIKAMICDLRDLEDKCRNNIMTLRQYIAMKESAAEKEGKAQLK